MNAFTEVSRDKTDLLQEMSRIFKDAPLGKIGRAVLRANSSFASGSIRADKDAAEDIRAYAERVRVAAEDIARDFEGMADNLESL